MIRRLRRWWRRRKAAQRWERWERAQPLFARIGNRQRRLVALKIAAGRALDEGDEDRARRLHRERQRVHSELQELVRRRDRIHERNQA